MREMYLDTSSVEPRSGPWGKPTCGNHDGHTPQEGYCEGSRRVPGLHGEGIAGGAHLTLLQPQLQQRLLVVAGPAHHLCRERQDCEPWQAV